MNGPVRAKALQVIGHLASAVGLELFWPHLAHFTQVSLQIIQEGSRSYEFGEAAFSYLCSITKIVKDEISSILPIIVQAAVETVKS